MMDVHRTGFLIALVSLGLLGAALLFQYVGGLAPCELCMWQRYPYVATAALGLIAGFGGRLIARAAVFLAGLAFLIEAGIAVFHSGVERKFWEGLSSCGGGSALPLTFSADAMLADANAPAPPRCDEIAWDLLGLSMANWNILIALGLAALCARAVYGSSSTSQ